MKKTLLFLTVIELLLLVWHTVFCSIGADYGLNEEYGIVLKHNTVLEYDLSPDYFDCGWSDDGRMLLARYGKWDYYQDPDTLYIKNNQIQGMDGYLWNGNSLYILNHRKGELEYYRPELITDEKSGDEVVTFTKIPESEYPVFDIANYRQTKNINRLCNQILAMRWKLFLYMLINLTVMAVVICVNIIKRLNRWLKYRRIRNRRRWSGEFRASCW